MNTGELVTDIGTILDSESAVECGLIDSVGTLSQAIDALYEMIKQ
jgi:ATP-dependent protease ClpP protease subunit